MADRTPDALAALPLLDAAEQARYARHLALPQLGAIGQRRLKGARVCIVGAGALGSPAALYLAGAGVGTIGLVDFDVVDASNLHRQLLYGTRDVGTRKIDAARARLQDVNPHVHVEPFDTPLTAANALEILHGFDVVVDGTDNFATRYLVNDACVLLGIPNVYGSIFRFDGQASVFATPEGPCYRCLYPEPPPAGSVPSCAEGGVLGVLPGIVGTIQATEAIKLITGMGDSLAGRLLLFDALSMEFHLMRIRRDPTCPACGTRTLQELVDYDAFCGTPPVVAMASHATSDAVPEITPAELAARLTRGDALDVVDVREPREWAAGHLPQARLVPLGTVREALDTFPRDRDIVVLCQAGMRSATALRALRAAGFTRVWSLAGGMNRWWAEQG